MATCRREAPAAHRKVSTAMPGSRRRCIGVTRHPVQLSAGPTRRSPGCVPARIACSETALRHLHTSTARTGRAGTWRTPNFKAALATAARRRSATDAPLPHTAPAIVSPARRARHNWCQHGPGGRAPRRATRPQRRRGRQWRRRARSGRTGRETAGRSGSCSPRTMRTRCRKLLCDRRRRNKLTTTIVPVPPFIRRVCPDHSAIVWPFMCAAAASSSPMSHEYFFFPRTPGLLLPASYFCLFYYYC